MSPQQQQRRDQPKTFLDASLVPLEKSLLERASKAEALAERVKKSNIMSAERAATIMEIAAEFRALAEELHHW